MADTLFFTSVITLLLTALWFPEIGRRLGASLLLLAIAVLAWWVVAINQPWRYGDFSEHSVSVVDDVPVVVHDGKMYNAASLIPNAWRDGDRIRCRPRTAGWYCGIYFASDGLEWKSSGETP